MTYSADFLNKVVQLYNSGTSTADLCAQFHISRSILYQWSEEAKVSNISKRDLATLQRHVATLENENSIYQKSLAALDLSIDNKVQIIDALKSEYSFYTLCRLLNLSKSTYINRQATRCRRYAFERKNHYHLPEKRLPFRCKKDSRKIDGARLYC